LTDFGISMITKTDTSSKTLESTMINSGGTPYYMAPEQVMKPINKCYPYLTDIYGFGSLITDLFFDIKIEQGKRLEEL
jgi:serine/threonine protein kinase